MKAIISNTSDKYLEIQDIILKNIINVLQKGFDIYSINKENDLVKIFDEFTYTISTTSNQKNNKNNNVSTTDSGERENKLKEQHKTQTQTIYIY